MKTTSRSRSLTRSLMGLFGTNKQLSVKKRFPDSYYRHIYFDKKMFDGIDLVSKIERLSKKKAARLLIERGFRSYIGEKLKEAIQTEIAVDELRRKPKGLERHEPPFGLILTRVQRQNSLPLDEHRHEC